MAASNSTCIPQSALSVPPKSLRTNDGFNPYHYGVASNSNSNALNTFEFYRKGNQHFLSRLGKLNHRTPDHPSILNDSTANAAHFLLSRTDCTDEEKILEHEKWWTEIKTKVEKAKMERYVAILLNHPWPSVKSGKQLLYHFQSQKSHSYYSLEMGFLCSNSRNDWISDTPTPFQTSGQAFQAHTSGGNTPSPYISTHSSVARMIKYINHRQYEEGGQMFIISLRKLQQHGIAAKRTTDMLSEFPEYRKQYFPKYENGVKYVTDSHILVEKWIPAGAIECVLPVRRFMNIAESEGISISVIRKNKTWDKSLEAREIGLDRWTKPFVKESGKEDDTGKGKGPANREESIREDNLLPRFIKTSPDDLLVPRSLDPNPGPSSTSNTPLPASRMPATPLRVSSSASKTKKEKKKKTKASVLAGLGSGRNRVDAWRSYVSPGAPPALLPPPKRKPLLCSGDQTIRPQQTNNLKRPRGP